MVTSPAPTISSHQHNGSTLVSEFLADVGAAPELLRSVVASSGLLPADPGAAADDAGPVAAETVVKLVSDEESSVLDDLNLSPRSYSLDPSSAPLPCSWGCSLTVSRRRAKVISTEGRAVLVHTLKF